MHLILSVNIHFYLKQGTEFYESEEGVQSSSNSYHRHPNLFCGKRAPQLVITVKFCFLWFEFNALLTQFSTSIGVLWHLYWLKLNFQIIFRFVWSTKTENQGTVHFSRILDPIFATLMTAFHGVKIQKRSGCLFTKNYLIPSQSNIHLHLKDIFKKPLQCLDFCIRQLEFNIYNKTNYMHRKNIKFWKITLITPTTENEVFSPLIMV